MLAQLEDLARKWQREQKWKAAENFQ